jgi:hypothetical protein
LIVGVADLFEVALVELSSLQPGQPIDVGLGDPADLYFLQGLRQHIRERVRHLPLCLCLGGGAP